MPQYNSSEYISYCLAYSYRDYFIFLNKSTLLMMTAVVMLCFQFS